jgi:hypothetical protein
MVTYAVSMDAFDPQPPPKIDATASNQTLVTPAQAEALTRHDGIGGIAQFQNTEALIEIGEAGLKGPSLVLIRAIVGKMESDLRREQAKNEALEADRDNWKDKFYLGKETVSVLEERIRGLTKMKLLQNVLLSAGGVFVGLGAKLLLDQKQNSGLLFISFGLVFLFTGWLWPVGAKANDQRK